AAKDITVYAYELTTYILDQKIKKMSVSAAWSDTGVDINNHISIEFAHTLADLTTTFVTKMEEKMVLYGRKGKVVLPCPHFSSECFLYDEKGILTEHFVDKETKNGFTYEILETMNCIKEGKMESSIVPWKVTMTCAELFDEIEKTRKC
ncbi:MAG TPA: gfo/Idh/MocA family oxidoreductase, partial [Lachnospiraceae bacterium]|nr:gfo/Idh/MocA family oxidoreductase [Lachnospiraceae bacterium]